MAGQGGQCYKGVGMLCDVALGSEPLATYSLMALMVGMHRHGYANHEPVPQDRDLTAALQVGLVGLWVL
jgi:hypothetical protein